MAAQAIVYIVPADRDLVNSSKAIVIGTAISSHPELTANGTIVTVADFRVEQVLKGAVAEQAIRIVEPGGFMSGRAAMFPGSVRYEDGGQYLVLLDQRRDGSWQTNGWQLGQFQITTDLRGDRYLSRGGDEMIFGLDGGDGRPYIDQFRSFEKFQTFVRTLAADPNAPAREDYFVNRSNIMLARALQPERKLIIHPNFTRADYLLSGNFRWQSGPSKSWGYCCPGSYPSQFTASSASTSAVRAWNGNSTSINYTMTGETPGKTSSAADGANTILFDDPNNDVPTGAFAVGGISAATGNYTLSDGITYFATQEVDVVVEKNSSIPGFMSQSLAVSLLTHEVGHTLGFRHSDQNAGGTAPCAAPSPCAPIGQAVMAHVINSPGIPLQQWDHDAQQTVYGSGPVCTPPAITGQPQNQTINSGQSANLSVTASGTAPLTYQWFRGASGDTTNQIAGATSSAFNTGALTTSTQFWVRVAGPCSPTADSATATVTINCKPVITAQPVNQQVTSGSTATLSVSFSSSSAVTVTWYRGFAGDTSTQVGTGPSLTTPPITSANNFWAQLTNGCGSTNSQTASVTIASSCIAPQGATAFASATTINTGQQVGLQVGVNGTSPLQYQWYRGTAADQSNPIPGATTFSIVDTPTSGPTASYWVKVTNACGNTASNTVVVNVIGTSVCTAPAITTQPQNATIAAGTSASLTVAASGTDLHYAWFEGNATDTSKPFGTDSPTVTTRVLTNDQSFWVRVSNDCGSIPSATVLVVVKPGRHRSARH